MGEEDSLGCFYVLVLQNIRCKLCTSSNRSVAKTQYGASDDKHPRCLPRHKCLAPLALSHAPSPRGYYSRLLSPISSRFALNLQTTHTGIWQRGTFCPTEKRYGFLLFHRPSAASLVGQQPR